MGELHYFLRTGFLLGPHYPLLVHPLKKYVAKTGAGAEEGGGVRVQRDQGAV